MTSAEKYIAFLDANFDPAYAVAKQIADEARRRWIAAGHDGYAKGTWKGIYRKEFRALFASLHEDWKRENPDWDKDDEDSGDGGVSPTPGPSPTGQPATAK